MHKRIYVPLDNSPYSSAAMRIAIAIGKKAGATMVGSHVYAARLHDQRFRTMESGLPDEYRKEEQLEKQRRTHDSLISRGLEVITDSYLQTMAAACRTEGLEFQGVALEGKNWKELARDIESHNYDLVVMGAYGIGGTSGALLGSVAQRVARRIETDLLIVKQLQEPTENDRVVVCLDGSDRSFGALKLALELGSQFNKKVEAVSVYDPYLHYAVFHSLSNVLSTKARRLFRIEEQEELHEKIIDSGLAKIYQSHLDIAKRIAADDEVPLRTQLLDGKAWRGILRRVREHPPWLLLVGRTGIHGDDALDIGSNTENILRLAPCNILLTARKFRPKREFQVAETVHWTEEARQKMARVPASVKGMASKAVERLAIAEGHTMITSSIVSHAVERLFGPHGQSKPHAARNEGRTCRAQEVTTSFECSSCRYVHHDRRPVRCPICNAGEESFVAIARSSPNGDASKSRLVMEPAFDGRQVAWTRAAWQRLERTAERDRVRMQLEKQARVRQEPVITEAMVLTALGDAAPMTQGLPRAPWQDGAAPAALVEPKRSRSHSGEGQNEAATEPGTFECFLCGYVVDGMKPELCASCQGGQFKRISEAERGSIPEASFKILRWDDRAARRLRRIPEGFIREMARCRVEQYARRRNKDSVNLDVLQAKYESWQTRAEKLESTLRWTEEAQARIQRVPDFIRPIVIREVERMAQERGLSTVKGSTLDAVMRQWRAHPDFHGTLPAR